MDTKLMPRERLATIVADATAEAAANVTGIFRNERMTWTQQGVHAAAWNAVMHDEQVGNALRMVSMDGAADYESAQLPRIAVTVTPDGIGIPAVALMEIAGRSNDPGAILGALRLVWSQVALTPDAMVAHMRAFDETIVHLGRIPNGERGV